MQTDLPSAEDVRDALLALTHAQMRELARTSSVPFTTLWKIRDGNTGDPRLNTVRAFLPHLPAKAEAEAQQ